jgi:hypothetical protein
LREPLQVADHERYGVNIAVYLGCAAGTGSSSGDVKTTLKGGMEARLSFGLQTAPLLPSKSSVWIAAEDR